jgi:predicted transcriptional regulator
MPKAPEPFSRREREIMHILYTAGKATAAEVLERLHEPPGYSAVRAMLRILEEKGHVRHEQEGLRYVYAPTRRRQDASRSAVRDLVSTFFDGSPVKVVSALLDEHRAALTDDDLDRLSALIERARKEGR